MMILNRIKLAVDRTIAAFSVAVMIALVVCVVWQVFSRYVLNQPSTLTDELARFLMIWVGLLGAAYTVGAQRHLAIDLLAMTLPPRRQALLSVIINLLIFIFAGSVIVTGGVKLIEKTLSTSQVSAAMQIPMGYVYLILPLTGLIMMFYAVCFVSNGLKNMKHAEAGANDGQLYRIDAIWLFLYSGFYWRTYLLLYRHRHRRFNAADVPVGYRGDYRFSAPGERPR